MDEKQFDGITRALAGGMTRRGGIGALIAAVAGAAGVSVAAANAGRRHEKLACRNANSECTSNDQCCSGSCVPKPEGGTGFRCAKPHRKGKGNGGGKGGGKSGGSCSSLTCGGCCDGTTCRTGDETNACGHDGLACAHCGSSMFCSYDRICVPYQVCQNGCQYSTVQEAIAAASSGATIYVGPGEYTVCDLEIPVDITIIGAGAPPLPEVDPEHDDPEPPAGWDPVAENTNGTTFMCQPVSKRSARPRPPAGRLLIIPAATSVLISKVLFARGSALGEPDLENPADNTGQGGLIVNMGSLALRNCMVASGYAQSGGGAILNRGTLYFDRSSAALNTTDGACGAILSTGTLNIGKYSIVEEQYEAAGFVWNSALNPINGIGGAICSTYLRSGDQPVLTMTDYVYLYLNKAYGLCGGGIFIGYGAATIGGCSQYNGGAACGRDEILILANFVNGTGGYSLAGGGIAVGTPLADPSAVWGAIVLQGNTRLAFNRAPVAGGLYYAANTGTLTLKDAARIESNTTFVGLNGSSQPISGTNRGAGMYLVALAGDQVTLQDSVMITGNRTNSSPTGNVGGGIFVDADLQPGAGGVIGATAGRVTGNTAGTCPNYAYKVGGETETCAL